MTAPRDAFPDDPLTLHTPADVLALVPFCLGYLPQESLVAVSLRAQEGTARSVGLVARVDLVDVLDEPQCADQLRRHLARDAAREVLLVVYCDRFEGPEASQVARIAAAWRTTGLEVCDCLLVTGREWRSMECDPDPHGGPPRVHPLESIAHSKVPAEMVLRGATVAPSRADRLAFVTPGSSRRIRAVMGHAGTARTSPDPGSAFRAWRRLLASAAVARQEGGRRAEHPAHVVGRVAGSLGLAWFRDVLLVDAVTPGDLPLSVLEQELTDLSGVLDGVSRPLPERLDAAGDVFAQLARGGEGRVRADALAALSWVQWYAGDLGFARDLAQQSLACWTEQTLAALVCRLAAQGVPPRWAAPAAKTASRPIRD